MLKNLSLNKKLAFGFGTVIIGLILVGLIALTNINKIDVSVMDLAEVHIPLFEAITEVDVIVTSQELAITQYAVHKEEEFIEKFHEFDVDADAHIEKVITVLKTDQDLIDQGWMTEADTIAERHDLFVKSSNTLLEAIKAGAAYEEWDLLADKVMESSAFVMESIDKFLEMNTEETEKIASAAEIAADSAKSIITIVGILTVVIGSVLAFVIGLSITK
ncbi:MCP four helix bundle domain-containing protein, partial [Candidatus Omnitrophota bacterium]